MGYDAFHAYVQEVKYEKENLFYQNKKIDLVHHKFDAFIKENGQDRPCIYEHNINEIKDYIQCLKDKNTVCINPLPSMKVAENKRVLALLHDRNIRKFLKKNEIEAINKLVPDTRCLKSNDKELLSKVLNNKNEYVIKNVLDTRSRGVFIGKDLEQKDWKIIVKNSIDFPRIIQKYVQHKSEMVHPINQENKIKMFSNIALYLVKGKGSGLLCRASTGLKSNFYASGILRPVYIFND